jgi:hypothetical protein
VAEKGCSELSRKQVFCSSSLFVAELRHHHSLKRTKKSYSQYVVVDVVVVVVANIAKWS